MSEVPELLRRPVFALSTGRSGSTLVQRLLNCHRQLVLWGEHFGFLGSAAAAVAHMQNPAQRHFATRAVDNRAWNCLVPTLKDPGAPLEWVNPCAMDEYVAQLRTFIEAYFASRLEPGQRWGFKEIRYNSMPTIRGLALLYPECRFVFVKRDAVEVTRSKVYAFVKEAKWQSMRLPEQRKRIRLMLKEVNEHYRVYDAFTARHPALAAEVSFEDLVADSRGVLGGLLGHLDLDPGEFDWDLADEVMGRVITSTKRDEALMDLIRNVQAGLAR